MALRRTSRREVGAAVLGGRLAAEALERAEKSIRGLNRYIFDTFSPVIGLGLTKSAIHSII